jgi:hypothetical protein
VKAAEKTCPFTAVVRKSCPNQGRTPGSWTVIAAYPGIL